MALNFTTLKTRITTLLNDTSKDTLAWELVNEAYKIVFPILWETSEWWTNIIAVDNKDFYDISWVTTYDKIRTVKAIQSETSWTTDWTTASKLVDSTASFASTLIWKYVYNTTDDTSARITAVDSTTILSVDSDVFASWEAYVIWDGIHYVATEVQNEDEWNIIKSSSVDSTSNVLTHFFIRNQTLELYPTPSDENQIIRITYEQTVADLTWTDVPAIDEEYHEALTYKPLHLLFLQREDINMAREYKRMWDEKEREMKKDWSSKSKWIVWKIKTGKFVPKDFSKDTLITI